jgi:hypothetical protein
MQNTSVVVPGVAEQEKLQCHPELLAYTHAKQVQWVWQSGKAVMLP